MSAVWRIRCTSHRPLAPIRQWAVASAALSVSKIFHNKKNMMIPIAELVLLDGHTVRGCANTLPANDCLGEWCNVCWNVNNAQGCNNQVYLTKKRCVCRFNLKKNVSRHKQQYPEIRLSCHQCNGNLNSTCAEAATSSPTICNIFDANNQCYIRRSSEC